MSNTTVPADVRAAAATLCVAMDGECSCERAKFARGVCHAAADYARAALAAADKARIESAGDEEKSP